MIIRNFYLMGLIWVMLSLGEDCMAETILKKPGSPIDKVRKQCIDILKKASLSENAFVRSAAYRAAGESGDSVVIPLLIRGTQDVYPTARQFSLQALNLHFPKEALKIAKKMSDDTDVWVKSLALEVLGEQGGSEFIPQLRKNLKSPDESIKLAAATALVKLGDTNSLTILLNRLRSGDSHLRNQAIGYLGKLKIAKARTSLVSSLEGPDSEVIYYSLKALGKGEKVSLELVTRLRELIHHAHPSVRKEALILLGRSGIPGTEALIQGSCADVDPMVRLSAAVTLVRLKSKFCRPVFGRLLNHSDFGVRSATARILGQIEIKERTRLLAHALQDDNTRVRTAAARAIGLMGGPEAFSLLYRALKDSQHVIQAYAAGNLIKLVN